MTSTTIDRSRLTEGAQAKAEPLARTAGAGSAELISLDCWHAFVESRPESTPFHHRQWIGLIHDQYRFPICIPAILRGGAVAAALPFALTTSLSGRRKLVALPFTDSFPMLAVDRAAAEALRAALAGMLAPQCKSVNQRTDRSSADGAADFGWYRHEIDTSSNYDAIAGRFSKSLRRNLKLAQKQGLNFERRTDVDALNLFYDLHVRNRRRLGVPVQPRSFFARLFERMLQRELGFIGVASSAGQAISAMVFLSHRGTWIAKYAASREGALACHPNEFLVNNILKRAAQEGVRCLDYGITPVNQVGLLDYKRRWGGQELAVGFECYAGTADQSSDPSRMLKLVGPAIRWSPPVVCRMLGDLLYKYSA